MTESLLSRLEDRVMTLVAELEDLHKEMYRIRQENDLLKADRAGYAKKLQGLIALLESMNNAQEPALIHDRVFSPVHSEELPA